MQQNELMHHGVKGMKWGVRKKSYGPSGIVSTQKRKKPIGTMDGDGWSPKFRKPIGTIDENGPRSKPKSLITVATAQKNASRAAEAARRKSVAESRASGDKGIGSFARANRKALAAKRQAYNESIANDKAYNKQVRAERKAEKQAAKVKKGEALVNKKLLQEQKELVKDLMKNYDSTDPYREEAMQLLRELQDDLD